MTCLHFLLFIAFVFIGIGIAHSYSNYYGGASDKFKRGLKWLTVGIVWLLWPLLVLYALGRYIGDC